MDNVHQRIRLSLFPSVSLFTVVKSVFTSLKGKYYLNNAPEKRTSYILPDVYIFRLEIAKSITKVVRIN